MALPKKKKKYDIDINPPEVGIEPLEYGKERIMQLLANTDTNTNFLPKTIGFEDIDDAAFEYVNSEELELTIDGKKVPVLYVDNERWAEFEKTWKFSNLDRNIIMPFITVRRIDKAKGTRIGNKSRVAQGKRFRYLDVPIQDEGQVIYLRYKIPEPTNVDLIYKIMFFGKYLVDVNQFDEQMLRNFASIQGYVFVKGNPFPVLLEDITEEGTMGNIDGKRYFASSITMRIKGFIQDEREFEITKTSRKPRIGIDL
ncbi:MAG: hypothetical protein ACOCVF_01685 [bacterium]